MTMKEWIKQEILQSVTVWIFVLCFLIVTIAFFVGKLDGGQYITALPILTGLAFIKRATTQGIVAANGEGK